MNLKDKIKQDIVLQEQSKVDWKRRKVEWLESIDILFNLIKGWFNDYEKESLVKFSYSDKSMSEEYIGSYKTNVLHVNFANGKEIIIEPAGTLIIGAWGRCDFSNSIASLTSKMKKSSRLSFVNSCNTVLIIFYFTCEKLAVLFTLK